VNEPTHRPRAIIFDWDNTLVDSWPVIQDALNTTFRTYDMPEWDMTEVRTRVRKSTRDSFPELFGDAWEAAVKVFYDRYEEIHAKAVRPAEGAASLLETLNGQGIYLGVVSNKRGDYLRKEADNLDWSRHFGEIIGALDAERDKPDPAPVHMALKPGGIPAGPDVWFVGDADIDLNCAANAGCVPVLVRAQSPASDEFPEQAPLHYFENCQRLCNYLKTM